MPRFVVERTYTVGLDEMPVVGRRSREVRNAGYPEIIWEHSHVVLDDDGAVKTFCIYEAPSEEMVREHADAFGSHMISNVYELVDDVTPEEIRRRAEAAKI